MYNELDQELDELKSDETHTESDEKALQWLFKYDQYTEHVRKRHLKKRKRNKENKRVFSR